MEVNAVIEKIFFYNQYNGYTIGEIIYRKKKVKIVGFLPDVEIGDTINVLVEMKKENEEPYLEIISNIETKKCL